MVVVFCFSSSRGKTWKEKKRKGKKLKIEKEIARESEQKKSKCNNKKNTIFFLPNRLCVRTRKRNKLTFLLLPRAHPPPPPRVLSTPNLLKTDR